MLRLHSLGDCWRHKRHRAFRAKHVLQRAWQNVGMHGTSFRVLHSRHVCHLRDVLSLRTAQLLQHRLVRLSLHANPEHVRRRQRYGDRTEPRLHLPPRPLSSGLWDCPWDCSHNCPSTGERELASFVAHSVYLYLFWLPILMSCINDIRDI